MEFLALSLSVDQSHGDENYEIQNEFIKEYNNTWSHFHQMNN